MPMMRLGNKRAMWRRIERISQLLAEDDGRSYAEAQIRDTRLRQAVCDLFHSYGAYGLFAMAVHDARHNRPEFVHSVVQMLPGRHRRRFDAKACRLLEDGNASQGIRRCVAAYVRRYVAGPERTVRAAAMLAAAEERRARERRGPKT